MVTTSDPAPWVMQTYLAGSNDTGAMTLQRLKRDQIAPLDRPGLEAILASNETGSKKPLLTGLRSPG